MGRETVLFKSEEKKQEVKSLQLFVSGGQGRADKAKRSLEIEMEWTVGGDEQGSMVID